MKIVIMGPQGSGKGTQAKRLASEFGIPHISTGDLLRERIEKNTELSMVIAGILDRGDLVPDDIISPLVNERLSRTDCARGFIADGFPRNLKQVLQIKAVWHVDWVIQLWIDTETSIKRLAQRLNCPKCKKIYGPGELPKNEEICDNCGASLVMRSDDQRVEVIIRRLETYWREIPLVLEYYRSAGVLRTVDGRPGVDSVFQYILQTIGELPSKRPSLDRDRQTGTE